MAPGFAVGLSIGRIGCLLAGCCFGRPTLFPIALVFDDFACAARPIGVPLHATQLYESAGAIVLGIALWWTPNKPVAGLRFAALLLGYGLLRAGLETLRFDYRGWVGGVSAPTIASLLAAIAGLLLLGRIAITWRHMFAARPQ